MVFQRNAPAHVTPLQKYSGPTNLCGSGWPNGNEMFCRASFGALAWEVIEALRLTTMNGLDTMARFSRISDTYRRRLRLSSRDVVVAVALTALAGGVVVAALWKAPSPGTSFPEAVVRTGSDP